jgi:hypothetical protein
MIETSIDTISYYLYSSTLSLNLGILVGDIIVGYRQHVLHNKLNHSDTDNDIPYHIHDLVRLTHLQQQVGLQATIINCSRYSTNHNIKCTALLPYNIYSALHSVINPPTTIILDIDSNLIQSKIQNKKIRALGKAFYPTDKDKLKKSSSNYP